MGPPLWRRRCLSGWAVSVLPLLGTSAPEPPGRSGCSSQTGLGRRRSSVRRRAPASGGAEGPPLPGVPDAAGSPVCSAQRGAPVPACRGRSRTQTARSSESPFSRSSVLPALQFSLLLKPVKPPVRDSADSVLPRNKVIINLGTNTPGVGLNKQTTPRSETVPRVVTSCTTRGVWQRGADTILPRAVNHTMCWWLHAVKPEQFCPRDPACCPFTATAPFPRCPPEPSLVATPVPVPSVGPSFLPQGRWPLFLCVGTQAPGAQPVDGQDGFSIRI